MNREQREKNIMEKFPEEHIDFHRHSIWMHGMEKTENPSQLVPFLIVLGVIALIAVVVISAGSIQAEHGKELSTYELNKR